MIRKALALAYKDFLLESGKKSLLVSLLFLSFILTFLSSYVLVKNSDVKPEIGSLTIWLILVYIVFQTMNRSLAAEDESGCWEALRLCPISSKVIFWGKLIYNYTLILLVQILSFPFFIIFFDFGLSAVWMLIPVSLTLFGFVALGLLVSLLTLNNQGRDILTGLISLPLYLPALFLGLNATIDLAHGMPFQDIRQGIVLLIVYDMIALVIAYVAFDAVHSEG